MMAGGDFQNGFIAGRGAFLREKAERYAALESDLAIIRRLLAKNQGKQRGLARAVWTDEANAVLPVDGKGHIGEQSASAESFAKARNCEHEPQSVDARRAGCK